MSYQWLAWAVEQKAPSTHAFAILCALAGYADQNGECWPSRKRLASQTRQTPRSVTNQIGALINAGLLEKAVVRGDRTGYRLLKTIDVKDACAEQHTKSDAGCSFCGETDSVGGELVSIPMECHSSPSKPAIEPVKKQKNLLIVEEEVPSRFKDFWDLFPRQRRGNRDKALHAYSKALTEKRATEEEIHEGLKEYIRSDEVRNGFAKGAAAWLNDDRWAVDYSRKKARTGPATDYSLQSVYDAAMADQTFGGSERSGSRLRAIGLHDLHGDEGGDRVMAGQTLGALPPPGRE